MNPLSNYIHQLQCPHCRQGNLSLTDTGADEVVCELCTARYHLIEGRPVLLRADNILFNPTDYRKTVANLPANNKIPIVPTPSVNLASENVLLHMKRLLHELPSATVLVVGGGRQRSWLNERLGAGDSIRVLYSDIDVNADVDLFCDGHDLPFQDGMLDAVVTTAVLEHVLHPDRVVAEIHRVLKSGGLLYSELPFMQQVHEGAYDFTRYTLSGHRRLLNRFTEIESGMVAGPATVLVWAVENFALAFISAPVLRKTAKALVRLCFSWIKYTDFLLTNRPEAMDGASCTYLLGRKIDGYVSDADIIARYVGAKHVRHT